MKPMTMSELKKKTDAQLRELSAQRRDVVRELRFKVSQKQLKNIREIRATKHTIARIATVLAAKKTTT